MQLDTEEKKRESEQQEKEDVANLRSEQLEATKMIARKKYNRYKKIRYVAVFTLLIGVLLLMGGFSHYLKES